jgi:uncharacterized protein
MHLNDVSAVLLTCEMQRREPLLACRRDVRSASGGRYLLDTVKGADLGGDFREGWLVVDLNFAYNPSCAYSPLWTCPLAPAGNTVPAALPVGELTVNSTHDPEVQSA